VIAQDLLDFARRGSELPQPNRWRNDMDRADWHSSDPRGAFDSAYSSNSSLREKIIEHLFVGELLRTLWRKGARRVELLRAEVDAGRYDLVLECNGIIRHIQLKSSYRGAKTSRVNINVCLQQKARGCMIWIMFDPHTPSFGERVARHTKGNRLAPRASARTSGS
jgi:hypothetical protein